MLRLGTNLAFCRFYATQWPFANILDRASVWKEDPGELRADGYPRSLKQGDTPARTVSLFNPPGRYTLVFRGRGKVRVSRDAEERIFSKAGVYPVTVPKAKNGIVVEIIESDPKDPIHQLELFAPGQKRSDQFHKQFLANLKDYHAIRVMDWLETNETLVENWSERTLPDRYTQVTKPRKGVSHEVCIDLAATLGSHLWTCIPPRANDEYVRQMAILYRDRMPRGLGVFLEFGNELWNLSFRHAKDAQKFGQKADLHSKPLMAGLWWQVKRSAECVRIWKEVYGASFSSRVKTVLAGQSASTDRTEIYFQGLDNPLVNASDWKPDAFAIAPYFGGHVTKSLGEKAKKATTEELLVACEESMAVDVRANTRKQQKYCVSRGLPLIFYEGGCHLRVPRKTKDGEPIDQAIRKAHRDPRMGECYRAMLAMILEEVPDTLFMHFNNCQAQAVSGCWGAREYQDQPAKEAPKAQALEEWLAKFPKKTRAKPKRR